MAETIETEVIPEGWHTVRCDQCQLLRINGIVCHESGCPNMGARYDAESDEWVKQRTCFDCGYECDAHALCCTDDTYDSCERCHVLEQDANGPFDGLCASCRMMDELDEINTDDDDSLDYCKLHDTWFLPSETCNECTGLCECGRALDACATADHPHNDHGDRN